MALSQSQKTLLIRSGSALVAVIAVALLYLFLQINGLRILVYLAVILGARELVRLLFAPATPRFAIFGFFASLGLIFVVSSHRPEGSSLTFSIIALFLCCYTILKESQFSGLEELSLFWGKSLLGFLYLGLMPSYAYRVLDFSHGALWFCTLLLIVFAGDTFAYAFGLLFGRNKLMPNISPKKTLEGALGGLVGSILASVLMSQWLIPSPILYYVIMGACVGVVAQLGDLFESVLKRIANRKDSGSIMPGHGGILDRLDGVLFSAPVLFLFAEILEKNLL